MTTIFYCIHIETYDSSLQENCDARRLRMKTFGSCDLSLTTSGVFVVHSAFSLNISSTLIQSLIELSAFCRLRSFYLRLGVTSSRPLSIMRGAPGTLVFVL